MANSNLEVDLIVTKINVLNESSIEYLEKNLYCLMPFGKYQTYLLTSAIVINLLKKIGAFDNNKISTNDLLSKIIDTALIAFYDQKRKQLDGKFTMDKSLDFFLNQYISEGRKLYKLEKESLNVKSMLILF